MAKQDIYTRIEKEADPLGFLMDMANGKPIEVDGEVVTPSVEQRLKAHLILEKKLSDQKSERNGSGNPFKPLDEKQKTALREKVKDRLEKLVSTLERAQRPDEKADT